MCVLASVYLKYYICVWITMKTKMLKKTNHKSTINEFNWETRIWEGYAVYIQKQEYCFVLCTFKTNCSMGGDTQTAIKLNGCWNKEKRTWACVLVFASVCACTHEGLRKIIAIDLRRRNVEMLPDGTFSCEWLRMRRVILEKARAERCSKCTSKHPDFPSGWSHSSSSKSKVYYMLMQILACEVYWFQASWNLLKNIKLKFKMNIKYFSLLVIPMKSSIVCVAKTWYVLSVTSTAHQWATPRHWMNVLSLKSTWTLQLLN